MEIYFLQLSNKAKRQIPQCLTSQYAAMSPHQHSMHTNTDLKTYQLEVGKPSVGKIQWQFIQPKSISIVKSIMHVSLILLPIFS